MAASRAERTGRARVGVRRGRDPTAGVGVQPRQLRVQEGCALVHVYADGSVSVTTGGIEMGQGISSNVAAVVARTFGISERRVRVESTNTTREVRAKPGARHVTPWTESSKIVHDLGRTIIRSVDRHPSCGMPMGAQLRPPRRRGGDVWVRPTSGPGAPIPIRSLAGELHPPLFARCRPAIIISSMTGRASGMIPRPLATSTIPRVPRGRLPRRGERRINRR